MAMAERSFPNMHLPSKYDYDYDYEEKLAPLSGNGSDDNSSDFSPTLSQKRIFKSSSSLVSSDSLPNWYDAYSRRELLHEEYDFEQGSVQFGSGNNTLVFTARRRKNPIYIAVVIFSVIGLLLYARSHAILHSTLGQVSSLSLERRSVDTEFKIVEHDMRKFQRTIVRLSQRTGGNSDENGQERNDAMVEMIRLQDKIKGTNDEIESLQSHLQDLCRADAIAKYGNGIVRVELQLEFKGSQEVPASIIMEMASFDQMPHSVFMFLEMVDAKLYDGCSFIMSTQDTIKAAPLPYDGSSSASKFRAFTRRGLESVAFKEYSQQFPHKEYTIGFAADGSPSFFINTEDNSEIHEGDPCFAKIVSGFDTVQRLKGVPTRDGMWFKMRIGIKRAMIL
jgi:cyclophilin family peptidyl-prolyl cis-trans isomerase